MIQSSRGLSRVVNQQTGDGGVRPAEVLPPAEVKSSHQPRQRAGNQAKGRHWLILRGPHHDEVTFNEVFTVGQRLAVFSFREEAEAFLRARAPDAGWRVEEFWTEELVSMLHGPLAGFGQLVLDPLPEVEDRAVDSLVSVGRKEFVGLLASRSRPPSLRPTEHLLMSRHFEGEARP